MTGSELQTYRFLCRPARLAPLIWVLGSLLAGCSGASEDVQEFDTSALKIGEVRSGSFVRTAEVAGKLVPATVLVVSAATDGVVDKRLVEPGARVEADTLILSLAKPQTRQEARDADLALRAAEAAYRDLEVRLDSALLAQQADVARITAEWESARLQAESDKQLYDEGLVPEITRRKSELAARQTETRYEQARDRLARTTEAHQAQLATARETVAQSKATTVARQAQLEGLSVRAGMAGVLRDVTVQPGQTVTVGTQLAEVVDPASLKADLQATGPGAAEIAVGQVASLEIGPTTVAGQVAAVDQAMPDGTVRLEITPDQPFAAGAAPDDTVTGAIALERIDAALLVGVPDGAAGGGSVRLFRINADDTVTPVTVELGGVSGDTILVRSGLAEGDRVVLSDTSTWDETKPVRLR